MLYTLEPETAQNGEKEWKELAFSRDNISVSTHFYEVFQRTTG